MAHDAMGKAEAPREAAHAPTGGRRSLFEERLELLFEEPRQESPRAGWRPNQVGHIAGPGAVLAPLVRHTVDEVLAGETRAFPGRRPLGARLRTLDGVPTRGAAIDP